MAEVRCPGCRRFICEVPAGTPVRAYCRDCKMKFETTPGEPLTDNVTKRILAAAL